MFWVSILIFIIPAAVIIGVNIIKTKIFFGEADDAINHFGADVRFNPRGSLNKFLNVKMVYYWKIHPLSVRWLVFYSNYIVPMLAAVTLLDVMDEVITGAFLPDAHSILYLIFIVSNLFNVVTIRGIDKLAFYFNLVPSVLLIALTIIPYQALSILSLVVLLPFIAGNVYYFTRRKDLFLLTLRQLKEDAAKYISESDS